MPYDNQNYLDVSVGSFDGSFDDTDYLIERFSENDVGETQTEHDVLLSSELLGRESDDINTNDIDYSFYLEEIIDNQNTIITNQESLIFLNNEIRDNSYRLYYFIGGLYVAFAIIIMIKFFKTFLF